MNIFYASNRAFEKHIPIAMYSVLKHTKHFYVLNYEPLELECHETFQKLDSSRFIF